ncbi:hypothetical protein ACT7DF_23225 [Bacillus cereus]
MLNKPLKTDPLSIIMKLPGKLVILIAYTVMKRENRIQMQSI